MKIFFIHIPKTAGTSFHNVVKNYYENKQTFPSDELLELHGGEYPPIKKYLRDANFDWDRIRFIHGHYGYAMAKKFPKAITVTFVRNPIKRVISNLRHIKKYRKEFRKESLEDIFYNDRLLKNQFSNIQTKYLLNRDTFLLQNLTYRHLLNAKNNLNKIDFVGITEHFEQSIQMFNKNIFDGKLTLSHTPELNKLSQEKKIKKYQVSYELYQKIVESNFYDIELYNFAMNLFQERLTQKHL